MLTADYFDGRSTRVRVVMLALAGEDLVITGEDLDLRVPFAGVKVDERLGRAPRRLRFSDGAFCVVKDLPALDALLSSAAHRDGWVDRLQRHLQFVLISIIVCAVLVAGAYKWALPWAAAKGAANMPPVVSRTLSVQSLHLLDGGILLPSRTPKNRQQALSSKFYGLRLPEGGTPQNQLLFRRSPGLGANAFTLPDGTIILLYDLITVMDDDE